MLQFQRDYSAVYIMPKERPTTRKAHRKEQLENYIAGKSSRPYCHTPMLELSFSEDQDERVNEEAGPSGGASSASSDRGVAPGVILFCLATRAPLKV